MRALSFKGFLETYLQELSGQQTLALPRLASLAGSRPRMVEPLVLWAVVTRRAEALSRLLGDRPELPAELSQLAALAEARELETALGDADGRLRAEYLKVWRSYVARRDAPARDARLKLAARERILALEAARPVSRYRMARDLGLNQGNLFAFLSQGNPRKLSLERAYELVRYLESSLDPHTT